MIDYSKQILYKWTFADYMDVGLVLGGLWVAFCICLLAYTYLSHMYLTYKSRQDYLIAPSEQGWIRPKPINHEVIGEAVVCMCVPTVFIIVGWGILLLPVLSWVVFSFSRSTFNYFDDKSKLAFFLTHPDVKFRERGKMICQHGFKTIWKDVFKTGI